MGQIGDNVGKGDNTFFISCIANNIFFLSKHLMYAFRIKLIKINNMKSRIKWQDISMKPDIKVETHNKQQCNQQSVTMKEEAN